MPHHIYAHLVEQIQRHRYQQYDENSGVPIKLIVSNLLELLCDWKVFDLRL